MDLEINLLAVKMLIIKLWTDEQTGGVEGKRGQLIVMTATQFESTHFLSFLKRFEEYSRLDYFQNFEGGGKFWRNF